MMEFSPEFQAELTELMRWRRDVRHFRTDPVDPVLLSDCLNTFLLAPSVGLSEPWRVIMLTSAQARQSALENFTATNANALEGYEGERAQRYGRLKLSGMQEAPVQLAIFCDEDTTKGQGLGAATMPEMRRYSVVAAITQFWLATRAVGLGVGWVSILDPEVLKGDLDVPPPWRLVAYLCVGWPKSDDDTPELERAGWEDRRGSLPLQER